MRRPSCKERPRFLSAERCVHLSGVWSHSSCVTTTWRGASQVTAPDSEGHSHLVSTHRLVTPRTPLLYHSDDAKWFPIILSSTFMPGWLSVGRESCLRIPLFHLPYLSISAQPCGFGAPLFYSACYHLLPSGLTAMVKITLDLTSGSPSS